MDNIKQKIKLLIACALTVFCGANVVRSVRASAASHDYLAVKFGRFQGTANQIPPIKNLSEASSLARRANELYPANYYFYTHVSGLALMEAKVAEDHASYESNLRQALYFSKYALELNPYNEEVRRIYVEALAEDGRVGEAISYWRENVVDREFWVGINQDMFASLLLRSSNPADLKEAVQMEPLVGNQDLLKKIAALKKSLR